MPGKRGRTGGHAISKRPRRQRFRYRLPPKSRRRKGAARPMRSLRTSYRGVPNQYRFMRETPAAVIDLHDYITTSGVTHNEVAVVKLQNVSLDILGAGPVAEFTNLFTNYKVDKIDIILRPMWQKSVQNNATFASGVGSHAELPNMRITRVNTKYMSEDLNLGTTNAGIREKLAEIQMKSDSLYSGSRPLFITTKHPRVYEKVADDIDGTQTSIVSRQQPWLSLRNATNTLFSHNELLVAQRLDHGVIPDGYYKYEYIVRMHFRTSQVV